MDQEKLNEQLLNAIDESPERCRSLLQQGADANAMKKDGTKALHRAAILGDQEVCRLLLEHGADVHAKDKTNWTAMHFAVCCGRIEVAKQLLQMDAAIINHCVPDGRTLDQLARGVDDPEMVEMVDFIAYYRNSLMTEQAVREALPVYEGCTSGITSRSSTLSPL